MDVCLLRVLCVVK